MVSARLISLIYKMGAQSSGDMAVRVLMGGDMWPGSGAAAEVSVGSRAAPEGSG